MTIVPPFETELDAAAVAALVAPSPPIPVVAGERARFGSRATVPVTVLRPSAALQSLHTALVDALEASGAVLRDARHVRDGFRAHVTDQRAGLLHPGEHLVLAEVAVVARAPGSRRVVAARVPLRP